MNIYVITCQSQRRNIDGDLCGNDLVTVEGSFLDKAKAKKFLKQLKVENSTSYNPCDYEIHEAGIDDCEDSFKFAVMAGMSPAEKEAQ